MDERVHIGHLGSFVPRQFRAAKRAQDLATDLAYVLGSLFRIFVRSQSAAYSVSVRASMAWTHA
jgi:hypothetical protein